MRREDGSDSGMELVVDAEAEEGIYPFGALSCTADVSAGWLTVSYFCLVASARAKVSMVFSVIVSAPSTMTLTVPW